MKLKLYQVDAFADQVFKGNPAAVCPLDKWLPDPLLQSIAAENNLSETAFFVETAGGYELRWFTPEVEVNLCGHATLASAHVLFHHLDHDSSEILFQTKSGGLKVWRSDERLMMDFPSNPAEQVDIPEQLVAALGIDPDEVYRSVDYLVIYERRQQIENLDPDFFRLRKVETRGVIVTAPGQEVDFVSRFFAPAVGINEDPVTGSAHTTLVPYWSARLGKQRLKARQLSRRGGELHCNMKESRVEIAGNACTYLEGAITVPEEKLML